MGLASFNRMRLNKVEEMKPENIQKRQQQRKENEEELVQHTHLENKEIEQEMPSKRKEKMNRKEE